VIYLVRHGQTAFNAERRMQGHLESDLTELGLRQAQAMAALLAREIPDPRGWRLVASPLRRTRATAAAVSHALGLPIEIDPRLIEIDVGGWSGRLIEEVRAEQPALFATRDWAFHGPGAETYDQMCERLGGWLEDLPPEPERRVIAVSHGVAGRVLRGLYAGMPRAEALLQDVPQDAIYRLAGGAVERLDCAPAG
jgi:broad specificity phosphatase PhoE